jgi:hypothetical protein
MAEWNLSTDQVTLEQKPRRRSPVRWLRENSIRISVIAGFVEAILAWRAHFTFLWVFGLAVVLVYFYLRRSIPQPLRRPAWMVAMSQAVAGLVQPVIAGLYLMIVLIGGLMLLILVLVLLGDLRRT